ncbi:MAG: YitT family protein [Deltaproteobacteria bacterium]|nr:YitT family protein [Deltaproteobacteria bacterium]
MLKDILHNLVLMCIGSFICAVAIKGILIPNQFISGGITGLALIVYYIFPFLPIGVIYFIMNIPLYVLGWLSIGRRFFWYSLVGLVAFSSAVTLPLPVFQIQDKILAALLAGILTGGGSGIILRSRGSAGGLDILSIMLLKRYSIRLGTTILAFNAGLLFFAAFRFSLESALYALVYMFVTSQVLNVVVTGLSQRKAVMIISTRWADINRQIIDKIQRGVTIVRGRGGFTGQETHILYSVVTFRELSRLKEIVRQTDPGAFVVVSETLEVMGHRIGNQPHW